VKQGLFALGVVGAASFVTGCVNQRAHMNGRPHMEVVSDCTGPACVWECRDDVDLHGWAARRMLSALGADPLPVYSRTNARARAWGLIQNPERARLDALVEMQIAASRIREAGRAARLRVRCGAKTRKGTACRNMSEPGKRRCKFHGGLSTGPRTPEGRARIAEAQRRRWAAASLVD